MIDGAAPRSWACYLTSTGTQLERFYDDLVAMNNGSVRHTAQAHSSLRQKRRSISWSDRRMGLYRSMLPHRRNNRARDFSNPASPASWRGNSLTSVRAGFRTALQRWHIPRWAVWLDTVLPECQLTKTTRLQWHIQKTRGDRFFERNASTYLEELYTSMHLLKAS